MRMGKAKPLGGMLGRAPLAVPPTLSWLCQSLGQDKGMAITLPENGKRREQNQATQS